MRTTASTRLIEGTTTELAKLLGVEYAPATGFIKTLVELKLAKVVGSRAANGGKGKPSIIYSIPHSFELNLEVPDVVVSACSTCNAPVVDGACMEGHVMKKAA